MVKLSTFGRDLKAMKEGEWIVATPEFPTIRIRTKAMGAEYSDNQAARMKRAARNYGGSSDKIGQRERTEINIDALIEVCLLDVEGFENDDGTPTTFDEFCQSIRKEENFELARMAFECAQEVGRRQNNEVEDAKGN